MADAVGEALVSAGLITGEWPDFTVEELKGHVHLVTLPEGIVVYQAEGDRPIALKKALSAYLSARGLDIPQDFSTSQDHMLTEFAGTSLAEKAHGAYHDKHADLRGAAGQLARLHAAGITPRKLRRQAGLRAYVPRKRSLTGEFINGFAKHFGGNHSLLKKLHRSLEGIVGGERHVLLYNGTIDDFTELDGRISLIDPDRISFGLPQEDLFKLLEDQRLGLSAGEKKALLEHYLAAFSQESGCELSPEERARFLDLYSIVAVSEHLKTCALFDCYAGHPEKSVSKDPSAAFRQKAQHHLQQAFNHLDVALDLGYEDGLFWIALSEYITSTPALECYNDSLRRDRQQRWKKPDGTYGFVRTMLGDIKKEGKEDVLYSLYLKQNQDSSFEAIVAREGTRFAHFEADSPAHAEALFESYVHCKNDFEMRGSMKKKLWAYGMTAGAILGVSMLGFYMASLMGPQLFGAGNLFYNAYWAANALCAKNALLDIAWDVGHGVVGVMTVMWPFQFGGSFLRGASNTLHKKRHERRYRTLAPQIEENYERRLG